MFSHSLGHELLFTPDWLCATAPSPLVPGATVPHPRPCREWRHAFAHILRSVRGRIGLPAWNDDRGQESIAVNSSTAGLAHFKPPLMSKIGRPLGANLKHRLCALGRYCEFASSTRSGAIAVMAGPCRGGPRPQYLVQLPFEPAPVAGLNDCLVSGSASTAARGHRPATAACRSAAQPIAASRA
jgi:hypothetical protein